MFLSTQEIISFALNNSFISSAEAKEIKIALKSGYLWAGNSLSQIVACYYEKTSKFTIKNINLFFYDKSIKLEFDIYNYMTISQKDFSAIIEESLFSYNDRISKFHFRNAYGKPEDRFLRRAPANWLALYANPNEVIMHDDFISFLKTGFITLNSRHIIDGPEIKEKFIQLFNSKIKEGYIGSFYGLSPTEQKNYHKLVLSRQNFYCAGFKVEEEIVDFIESLQIKSASEINRLIPVLAGKLSLEDCKSEAAVKILQLFNWTEEAVQSFSQIFKEKELRALL